MSRLPTILPFFALTTAGLEAISAQELARLPQITVQSTSYRRLSGTCQGDLASLASLRTVDDVFLELATWREIGRPRSSLKQLRKCSACLDLHPAAGVTVPIFHWDATSLPLANTSIDRVITNLPWGRQVPVETALPMLYRRLLTQWNTTSITAANSPTPSVCTASPPRIFEPVGVVKSAEQNRYKTPQIKGIAT